MRIILTTAIVLTSLQVYATHWLQYYVYFETEYIQGPWSRAADLDNSDYRYLAPRSFEDLFGTVEEQFIDKVMSTLQADKPEYYDWSFHSSTSGDTVILTTDDRINYPETIKNEITASMVFNGYHAVELRLKDSIHLWTLDDIKLPYLDLVGVHHEDELIDPPTEVTDSTIQDDSNEIVDVGVEVIPVNKIVLLKILLVLSVLLNIGLAGLFLRAKE